jgi:hypothetical protein
MLAEIFMLKMEATRRAEAAERTKHSAAGAGPLRKAEPSPTPGE